MSDGDRDRLLSHGYDGIEEYDNPLPGWWVWIFWATIVFSARLLGLLSARRRARPWSPSTRPRCARPPRASPRRAAPRGVMTDQALLALEKNAGAMAKGKEIFVGRCVPCHGDRGQGIVGPNLTDDYWLHGGRPSEIYHTITEGVPEKGMVPWKSQLSPEEIAAVTAYVAHAARHQSAQPEAAGGREGRGGRRAASLRGSMTTAPSSPPESPGARASHAQPGRHAALDAPQALRGALPPAPAAPWPGC